MRRRADIVSAVKKSLRRPQDWLLFFVLMFAVFALFVLIPVWTTPGNDVAFQISLFSPGMYALLISLSVLNALVIMLQIYIRREHRTNIQATVKHTGSGIGALAASVVATLGCAACYSSVLAVFGLGGTLFVAKYRAWIAGAAVLLALVAIFYSAKRIQGGCKVCSVD